MPEQILGTLIVVAFLALLGVAARGLYLLAKEWGGP